MRARGRAKQRPYPRRWARRVRLRSFGSPCGAEREVDGASPAGLRERGRGACLNRQPHASRSYGARDRAGCSGSGTDLPLGCSPARLPSAEERTPRRSPASHGRTGQTSWSKNRLRRPHRTGTASRSPPRRLMSAPHENRTATNKHTIGLLSRDRIRRKAQASRCSCASPSLQGRVAGAQRRSGGVFAARRVLGPASQDALRPTSFGAARLMPRRMRYAQHPTRHAPRATLP